MTAKKWPRGVSRSKLKSSFCVFDSCLTESEEKFMGNAPPDAAHVITNRSNAKYTFLCAAPIVPWRRFATRSMLVTIQPFPNGPVHTQHQRPAEVKHEVYLS